MKPVIVVTGLCVAVMAVMAFQAVRQELDLQQLRARMAENFAELKRKQAFMTELKTGIKEMKTELVSVNGKVDQLKNQKIESEKTSLALSNSLQLCNVAKANEEKRKIEIQEAINKIKADHEAAKQMAENDVTSLKQQILDRDKALCAFVDPTKEEARKLCGIQESPK